MINKNSKESYDELGEILSKLVRQATDSLVGQIVLVELLEEKGILTKSDYKKRIEMRNDEIKGKIAEYWEMDSK